MTTNKVTSVREASFWAAQLAHSRHWRRVLFGAVIASSFWMIVSRIPLQTADTAPAANPEIGFAAPDFKLQTFDGKLMTLSDLRGKVILVNFWASWCPPCRAEMPALNKVFERYRATGFVVLAVNTTFQDVETEARAFYQNLGLTIPAVLDRDGQVSRSYQVQALPTSFFIDSQGMVRDTVFGGSMTEALIATKVEQLLSTKNR